MKHQETPLHIAESFSLKDLELVSLANNYLKLKSEGYNNRNKGGGMGHAFTVIQVSGWLESARKILKDSEFSQDEFLQGTLCLFQSTPQAANHVKEFFDKVSVTSFTSNYNANISQEDLYEINVELQKINAQAKHYDYSDDLVDYAEKRHLVLP